MENYLDLYIYINEISRTISPGAYKLPVNMVNPQFEKDKIDAILYRVAKFLETYNLEIEEDMSLEQAILKIATELKTKYPAETYYNWGEFYPNLEDFDINSENPALAFNFFTKRTIGGLYDYLPMYAKKITDYDFTQYFLLMAHSDIGNVKKHYTILTMLMLKALCPNFNVRMSFEDVDTEKAQAIIVEHLGYSVEVYHNLLRDFLVQVHGNNKDYMPKVKETIYGEHQQLIHGYANASYARMLRIKATQ